MENDEVVLRNILAELVDLFGWSDSTPLHAALHVRNAVLNMRADLAVERARAEKAEANYAFMVERAANQHLDGYRELGARAAGAENEADRLRARLRETARILIAEVGADGPMDAEDAARKAVERMANLQTLADEAERRVATTHAAELEVEELRAVTARIAAALRQGDFARAEEAGFVTVPLDVLDKLHDHYCGPERSDPVADPLWAELGRYVRSSLLGKGRKA